MEISLRCYILVNCVLLFPLVSSKSVSLNDLIAAEEKRTTLQASETKVSDTHTSLRKIPKDQENKGGKIYSTILTKHLTGNIISSNKKISPLKYKKTFQIRTPLRPTRIKYSTKPRIQRITSTNKREINNDEKLSRNYIPLLKSLGILFDNMLGSDSGENYDTHQYKRQQTISSEECPCALKSTHKTRGPKPAQKATISTAFVSPQNKPKVKTSLVSPKTSSTSATYTVHDNIGLIRRNKNIPLLSARNTISSRRNNHGIGKGSLSTHYRDFEGYIARNNGSDENNNTRGREEETHTEDYQQHTNSSTRDDASRNKFGGTIGRDFRRNNTHEDESEIPATKASVIWSDEAITSDRRDGYQFERHDKFEDRGNETESREFLSKPHSRLRGVQPQDTTEILWKIQNSEKGNFNVQHNITSDQRVPDGNGRMAAKDQEIRRSNQTLALDDLSTVLMNAKKPNTINDKQKIVVIYDGYSIARDVNGENQLSEKAFTIHS